MSCLFRSLSTFISNMNDHQLRQMIVDYIEKNPRLCQDSSCMDYQTLVHHEFGSMSLQDYCRHMRQDSTWGGAIEIRAFCDMFDAHVHVHVLATGKVIHFQPLTTTSQSSFNIFRISWNGAHYEPLK
jgi:hypothetical protein